MFAKESISGQIKCNNPVHKYVQHWRVEVICQGVPKVTLLDVQFRSDRNVRMCQGQSTRTTKKTLLSFFWFWANGPIEGGMLNTTITSHAIVGIAYFGPLTTSHRLPCLTSPARPLN